MNNNESRFLIPFYLKTSSNEDPVFNKDWKLTEIEIDKKYIANYVYELFSEDNRVCSIYKFKDENRAGYGLPDPKEPITMKSTYYKPEETFSFILNELSLFYCQETSIGIFIIDIIHDDKESLKTITDKSFSLAHMIKKDKDTNEFIDNPKLSFIINAQNNESFRFVGFLRSLFPTDQGYGYELFKDYSNIKCNVYHRLKLYHKYDDQDLKYIVLLSRALHSSTDFEHYKDLLNDNIFYSSGGNYYWVLDNVGAVSFSCREPGNVPESVFFKIIHPSNVNTNYLLVYLLALHEKISLLNYNYYAVRDWNNPKKLKRLKDELLSFNIKFSYNIISDETNYQVFYQKLSSVMKITLLENDIQEVLDKFNEDQTEQHERRLNALLLSVGLLAIFSALIDSFSFASEIHNKTPFKALHIIFIIIIAIFIIIGVLRYFRPKK